MSNKIDMSEPKPWTVFLKVCPTELPSDVCWPETDRPPDISSAKMSLLRIRIQDLQPRQAPCRKGRRPCPFCIQKKRKLGGPLETKSQWLFIGWILARKEEESSCSCWAGPVLEGVRASPAGLPALLNWHFSSLIFLCAHLENGFMAWKVWEILHHIMASERLTLYIC